MSNLYPTCEHEGHDWVELLGGRQCRRCGAQVAEPARLTMEEAGRLLAKQHEARILVVIGGAPAAAVADPLAYLRYLEETRPRPIDLELMDADRLAICKGVARDAIARMVGPPTYTEDPCA